MIVSITNVTHMILSKFKRLILSILGIFFLVLGAIGYIVPGLPGTIFLILSATLFLRSSNRLYHFVTQNKLFGGPIRVFIETGAITLKAKISSCLSIWVFTIASIFLTTYGIFFILPVIILALSGTIYITSRPTANSIP